METRGRPSRRTLLLGSLVPITACSDNAPRPLPPVSTDDPPSGSGPGSTDSPTTTPSSPDRSSGSAGVTETVDLPDVETLRHRWAAYTAIWVGGEFSTMGGPSVEDGDWYYEGMYGGWAWLSRFADGRALLAGSGKPEERRSAADEREARAALVKGAPGWWREGLDVLTGPTPVHFACAYEDGTWRQVRGAEGGRGLDDLRFVLGTEKELLDELVLMVNTGPGGDIPSRRRRAARALVEAGPRATETQVKAVGKDIRDAAAGARAAREFAGKGRH